MWSRFAEWDALRRGDVAFEEPMWLLAGAVVVVFGVAFALWRGPRRIDAPLIGDGAKRWHIEGAWVLSVALRGLGAALIALTLARPVGLVPENPAGGDGIDLIVALDASGSMKALDGQLDGRRVMRLELAKRVVADFVRERKGDRVGLVVFGEHAYTQAPLTVDHRILADAIDRIEPGIAGDATAIGEAIALATRRLQVPGAPEEGRRIVLLLTDGRHNAGQLAPETAAEIARLGGVRIHTIGIGSQGKVPFASDSPGEPLRFEEVDLDRETLHRLALVTGGQFFHAQRPGDLAAVAAAIDKIEARPRGLEPRYRRASLAPFALALVLCALLGEVLNAHGFARRLP